MREFLASRVILVFTLTGKNASQKKRTKYRGASRDFEKGWRSMLATMVGRRKDQNNVRNYKFLAKYLYQHFKLFSIFIYNESSPMKPYQFFKIYKRFGKERDKTLMHQSMRKEKLRKAGLCFIKSCFIKS